MVKPLAEKNDLLGRGIAKRLRERRKALGWTQLDLSVRCSDVSQEVIQKIEIGATIYPRCIEDLARTVGVLPGWLQFGDEGVNWPRDVADIARQLLNLRTCQRDAVRKFALVYEELNAKQDAELLNTQDDRTEETQCG